MTELVEFEIDREQHGTTVRLVVAGELDIATAPEFRERCARELGNGAQLIVLDLSKVTFMDSSGLHALLGAHKNDSGRLRIIISPAVTRVIDISGVRGLLPIVQG